MKIQALSYSDTAGGAARAAYRIHQAVKSAGVDSHMYVNHTSSGDWTVHGPEGGWDRVMACARPGIGRLLNRLLTTSNPIPRSPAVMPSFWSKLINNSDSDVAHLHWVNNEMLSITDIGRITKPVVWTLHDMWAFCGAEHVTNEVRWQQGYTSQGRPAYESGFDLDRWVWRHKRRAWRRPMHIVAPSHWLAECARHSALLHDWPISIIHNPIDTKVWKPLEKSLARGLMGLPSEGYLLLFGTFGANSAANKGFDLLRSALQCLQGKMELQLVVFGQSPPQDPVDIGFPIYYTGHLNDDLSMRALYSAADAIVVPSRQEAFGQTASEALACSTPVIAFGATGLIDVVRHQQTGYLATPYDAEDLANGIQWVLSDSERYERLSAQARVDVVSRFSYHVIASQYLQVYKSAMNLYCGH